MRYCCRLWQRFSVTGVDAVDAGALKSVKFGTEVKATVKTTEEDALSLKGRALHGHGGDS